MGAAAEEELQRVQARSQRRLQVEPWRERRTELPLESVGPRYLVLTRKMEPSILRERWDSTGRVQSGPQVAMLAPGLMACSCILWHRAEQPEAEGKRRV